MEKENFLYLFDAAKRVLEAAEEHQEVADKAINNMNLAVFQLERRNEELRGQIRQEIKTALESSVGTAVDDLKKKFEVADQYADQAARRYEKAVRDYDQRVHGRVWNISALIIVPLIVGFIVGSLVGWKIFVP